MEIEPKNPYRTGESIACDFLNIGWQEGADTMRNYKQAEIERLKSAIASEIMQFFHNWMSCQVSGDLNHDKVFYDKYPNYIRGEGFVGYIQRVYEAEALASLDRPVDRKERKMDRAKISQNTRPFRAGKQIAESLCETAHILYLADNRREYLWGIEQRIKKEIDNLKDKEVLNG